MKQFWNERYAHGAYAYGKEPNIFFKQEIDKLATGKLLLTADGEGRNAVYAAKMGWETFACDLSEEGQRKALKLAKDEKVAIQYAVGDFGGLHYSEKFFDAAALIYAHFPPQVRSTFHKLLDSYLKEDGYIILEAFSKNHLKYNTQNPSVGGLKMKLCYSQ